MDDCQDINELNGRLNEIIYTSKPVSDYLNSFSITGFIKNIFRSFVRRIIPDTKIVIRDKDFDNFISLQTSMTNDSYQSILDKPLLSQVQQTRNKSLENKVHNLTSINENLSKLLTKQEDNNKFQQNMNAKDLGMYEYLKKENKLLIFQRGSDEIINHALEAVKNPIKMEYSKHLEKLFEKLIELDHCIMDTNTKRPTSFGGHRTLTEDSDNMIEYLESIKNQIINLNSAESNSPTQFLKEKVEAKLHAVTESYKEMCLAYDKSSREKQDLEDKVNQAQKKIESLKEFKTKCDAKLKEFESSASLEEIDDKISELTKKKVFDIINKALDHCPNLSDGDRDEIMAQVVTRNV